MYKSVYRMQSENKTGTDRDLKVRSRCMPSFEALKSRSYYRNQRIDEFFYGAIGLSIGFEHSKLDRGIERIGSNPHRTHPRLFRFVWVRRYSARYFHQLFIISVIPY
jgi:hypothetical protein